MPLTLPSDLATEIAQSAQVIPDMESVTVFVSANAVDANTAAAHMTRSAANRFIAGTRGRTRARTSSARLALS